MNSANKLLDKYAAMCSFTSDKQIADALRVRQSAVSNWRHANAHPSAESIERMCQAVGEPLRQWLPLIEAERARTPADKRVWLRLAQGTAAVALAATLYAFGRLDVQTVELAALAPVYIMRSVAVILAILTGAAFAASIRRKTCGDCGMPSTGR